MLWKISIESDNRSDSNIGKKGNCLMSSDQRISHNHPFYYCKEHPDFKNVNLETIEHHLLYNTDHKSSS